MSMGMLTMGEEVSSHGFGATSPQIPGQGQQKTRETMASKTTVS